MDGWAGLLGVVIAIGLNSFWQDKQAKGLKRVVRGLLILVVAGVSAFAATFSVQYMQSELGRGGAVERMASTLEAVPCVGVIMRTEPEARARIEAALDADYRSPSMSTTRAVLQEIRREYGGPAVRAASPELVVDAWIAATNLAKSLRVQSTEHCAEFMYNGVENVDELDPASRLLFNDYLAALERVYVDGRGKPELDPPFSEENWTQLGEIAGLTEEEWDHLFSPTAGDLQKCDAGMKLYENVRTEVHPNSQPWVMREFLSSG